MHTNSTLYARISLQWLNELRWLWPSAPWQITGYKEHSYKSTHSFVLFTGLWPYTSVCTGQTWQQCLGLLCDQNWWVCGHITGGLYDQNWWVCGPYYRGIVWPELMGVAILQGCWVTRTDGCVGILQGCCVTRTDGCVAILQGCCVTRTDGCVGHTTGVLCDHNWHVCGHVTGMFNHRWLVYGHVKWLVTNWQVYGYVTRYVTMLQGCVAVLEGCFAVLQGSVSVLQGCFAVLQGCVTRVLVSMWPSWPTSPSMLWR